MYGAVKVSICTTLPNGRNLFDYDWIGGDIGLISTYHTDLPNDAKPGDVLTLGAIRMRVIECNFMMRGYKVLRLKDNFDWLRYYWYRCKIVAQDVDYRLLATLAIWDFADVPMGEYPSWHHVKGIKRLIRGE